MCMPEEVVPLQTILIKGNLTLARWLQTNDQAHLLFNRGSEEPSQPTTSPWNACSVARSRPFRFIWFHNISMFFSGLLSNPPTLQPGGLTSLREIGLGWCPKEWYIKGKYHILDWETNSTPAKIIPLNLRGDCDLHHNSVESPLRFGGIIFANHRFEQILIPPKLRGDSVFSTLFLENCSRRWPSFWRKNCPP